ncbi:MAG: hypothetical protein GC162_16805 [Planctomycetes bacterium]|nr:hypothetical protein [Planctomycetota bacterium]
MIDPLMEEAGAPDEERDEARRQSVVDRRSGLDRRDRQTGSRTGLEHRRGPGRRRTDFTRKAEEGEMTNEQFLFVMAIDAFKRVNNRSFPTWTEVLEVIRKLGYRKTTASELNLPNTEDWTERPDAPAMPPAAEDSAA